ncbi:MAG: nucleotidyltransferase family protein [Patescibacteria group bacterium]
MEDIHHIQQKIMPILERYGATRSAIFGSHARGEATEKSDLDVLVDLPQGATLLDLVELKDALETALGMRVDVLTYGGIHPLLRDRIEREAVAL